MSEIARLEDLERWNGMPPGGMSLKQLSDVKPTDENPGIERFLEASDQVVQHWGGEEFAGLLLYGGCGTGKTLSALALGRALHDAGSEVFYRYVPTLSVVDLNSPVQTIYSTPRASRLKRMSDNGMFGEVTYDAVRTSGDRKRVLILDNYHNTHQTTVATMIDAAAQFGGFVIITSEVDPLTIAETRRIVPNSATEALLEDQLEHRDKAQAEALRARRLETALAVSQSLRSRIHAGIQTIAYAGTDQRVKNSFWSRLP